MKKFLLLVFGSLAALFAVAQLLQLLGLFGVGPSIAGAAFTAGGTALALYCFKSAKNVDRFRRRHSSRRA